MKISFAFLSLALILPISVALNLKQTAAYTTVESYLNYSESGLKETIDYLATRVKSNQVTSVRKDIHYYLRYRYQIEVLENIYIEEIFQTRSQAELEKLFQTKPLKFIVMERVSMVGIPNEMRERVGNVLSQYYAVAQQYGDFVIFKSRYL